MAVPNKFVQALLDSDLRSAEALFADFPDINVGYEPTGWTALHFMVENNILDSAKWLVEKGANPNQRDASGWTPLLLAIDMEGDCGQRERDLKGIFPYPADMTELLLKHGADANVIANSGRTPLELARRYGHTLAVELLIQHGASEA